MSNKGRLLETRKNEETGTVWKIKSYPITGVRGRQYAIIRNGRQYDNYEDRDKAFKKFRKYSSPDDKSLLEKAKEY